MIRRPPKSTLPDTLFPYTTLFRSIVLPTYNQTIKKDSPPVRLFSPSGTKDSYFGGFGWTGDGLKAPDTNTVWAARGDKLTPSTPVTLRWNNGQGQIFEIKLAIDQDYMFTVTQKVTNKIGRTSCRKSVCKYV